MPNLYYIEYGCSQEHCVLVIEAADESIASNYAELSAQESYYSFDCNYLDRDEYFDLSDDEFEKIEWEDMQSDIFYSVVAFNSNQEEHKDALKEQGGKPYVV